MGLLGSITQTDYYLDSNSWGNYQFTSLDNIITQFQIAYVGEDKIISKIKRADIAFHAQRAMQELSFDTFKSIKSQELEVPASLTTILPQDYVNYVKLVWSDSAGIEHIIYPTSKTSNPIAVNQDPSGDIVSEILTNNEFDTGLSGWTVSSNNPSNNLTNPGAAPYTWNSSGYVDADAGLYKKIYQTSTSILAGHTYRVSYDLTVVQGSVQIILIADDGTATEAVYKGGTRRAISGSYTQDIVVNTSTTSTWAINMWSSNINFSFDSKGGGTTPPSNFVGTIDNVTCYDLEYTTQAESDTWSAYKGATPSENQDDYQDNTYWPMGGSRFGLDPQHAQANGSFYMDPNTGKIHFSSNISGKTVILKYISDGLGTDAEMQVHKFAEEAMYKSILCAIMSAKANVGGRQLAYYKKDKFAAIRQAKLRLSNIKLEELTQILRGKSKHIKH